MLRQILQEKANQRVAKLNAVMGHSTSLSINPSVVAMGMDKINEISRSEINKLTKQEIDERMYSIFDTIAKKYSISKSDKKELWDKILLIESENPYHNFELLHVQFEVLDKLDVYKNMQDKEFFAFILFMQLDINRQIKLSNYKGFDKLQAELLTQEQKDLLEDLSKIPLGFYSERYEIWQRRYVQEIKQTESNMEFYKKRKDEFRNYDKGFQTVYKTEEIALEFEAKARVNIKKSRVRLKKGWDY